MPRKRRPGAPTANERNGPITRALLLTLALWLVLTSPAQAITPAQLRSSVYRTDPYLARIIDREDGRWDPTISYGGGHNPYDSYGLCQANPGTKMASAGRDWRTNPWTQLRWCRQYAVGRYGSEAQAWWFWAAHSWW